MKIHTLPKVSNTTILSEGDALIELFDHIEEKLRDYHLLGNQCSRKADKGEEILREIYETSIPKPEDKNSQEEKDLLEKTEEIKADTNQWYRRKESARKNERNLYKIKRMIQKAFINGELEK